MAKQNQKIKNKCEQLNLWCLDRYVLNEPLYCNSQAVDTEKVINFQCFFDIEMAENPTECF